MPHKNSIPKWQQKIIAGHDEVFGHVALITPVTQTHLIMIEPQWTHIQIELIEYPKTCRECIKALSKEYKVLEYVSNPKSRWGFWSVFTTIYPTCTSVARAVLGVRDVCFTPHGLYKTLLKKGAVDIEFYE